mmetsp:Transcript_40824/g.39416  ORF Transcript_40824/g.39416 Transcript_40824/m.39416 type:complete len:89 (+) Transcript_40824:813-1079(+)
MPRLNLDMKFKLKLKKEGLMGGTGFVWGQTLEGQLGIGATTEPQIASPLKIHLDTKIFRISLGAGHALALSVQNKVYSWGYNLLGQLG